jgi:hypothetical protein
MKNRYALGLQQVQQELVTLQNPGFYWITSQRQEDARVLLRQVVSHQQAATLVSSDEKPQSLLTPDPLTGPARIPLFSLPANKTGLQHLENDFARVLNSRSGLVLFYSNAAQWSKLSEDELTLLGETHATIVNQKTNHAATDHFGGVNYSSA